MIDAQYETLMRENMKQERDIAELKELLEQERAEKEQLMDHNEDNKMLINKLSKEYEVAKKKLTEELVDRRERRVKYDAEMERLRVEIDKRQREIEEMQAQAIEPQDMDILRLKAKKEFETQHALELEEKQTIINQIKEERDELRRNLEFLDTKHENLKFDSQREIESNKLKYREELQVLVKENQKLTSQIEMSKDRDMLRQARRELEEAKRRVEEYQKECNTLRKERDTMKDEKNDLVIAHNRSIEEERSKKREAIAQNDKLKFKIRSLEDDLQTRILEADKKEQTIIKLKSEKQNLNSINNEKEIAIETMRRQMNELKDQIKDKDDELQAYIRRRSQEDTDFELVEKHRFEKLQSDLDTLGREYRILETERANDREKHFEQFNRLEYNFKAKTEENRKLKRKLEEMEKEYNAMKIDLQHKTDEYGVIGREYK